MIDTQTEIVLTFPQLTDELPRRRQGRKVSIAMVYRWAQRGVRGVRLEALQTPSGLVTSREAYQRFLEALSTAREATPTTPAPVGRSAARRRRDDEKAASELARMGVR